MFVAPVIAFIGYVLLALDIFGWGSLVAIGVAMFLYFLAALGILHSQQNEIDALRKDGARVRVTARVGSWSVNLPNPGPGKVSLSMNIVWEVWVDQDVSTEAVALNLIYLYDRKWWQFWKRARFPQVGIPRQGDDTTLYRKRIYANQFQPFEDNAVFEYIGDRDLPGNPHWLLEFVLKTGMPAHAHRVPISFAQVIDDLDRRGTNPPL